MALRLSEAQAKQLGLTAPKAARPRKAAPRQRQEGFPPDVANGHAWEPEGLGLRCQCGMWLAYRRLPDWGHGSWEQALTMRERTHAKTIRSTRQDRF